jgi:phosphohistidine phosphatase SixA
MRLGLAACGLVAALALPLHAQVPASAPAVERSSVPQPGAELKGAALIDALRRGGYVIYFRHTATDFSRNDAATKSFDDCANQRPLSPQGRDDARRIGEAIRALRLPAGEVFASPMCRTTEHARLTFGQATPAPEVSLRERGEHGDYPGLVRLLSAPVKPGSNRWLFGHGNPFRAVAGAPHLAEGEAVVMKPDGRGWSVVARVAVADWPVFDRR